MSDRRATLRQRLTRRLKPIVGLFAPFKRLKRTDFDRLRFRPMDRAQWRRWYQVNKRYQRKMRALKRLTGRPIPNHLNALPRWAVR
jgi:hypothetical protein